MSNPISSASGTVTERVTVRDGEIPLLLVYEPSTVPQPAVIVLHGTRRTKEISFDDHDHFLRDGHFVRVYPDAPLHGEREQPGSPLSEASVWEDYLVGKGDALHEVMIPVVYGMAKEVSDIIDYLVSRKDIIQPKFGVYGFSVAGLMAFLAANLESRLNAAVCLCIPPRFLLMSVGRPYQWDMQTLKEAARYDPMNNPALFFPTSLFLGHGQMDDIVPIEVVRDVYHRLLPHYESMPERLMLKEYPNIRHYLDQPFPYNTKKGSEEILELRKEASDWLALYLSE